MLCVAVVWSYGPSLSGSFVLDDTWSIESNPTLRALWPLWSDSEQGGACLSKFETPFTARPLVNFSFALNYHFSELRPRGYRIVQIVLHCVAALSLWGTLIATLRLPVFESRFSKHASLVAWMASLLWALHPLTTDTVAYITQRTELMMAIFYLLVVWSCLQYWQAESRRKRVTFLVAVFVLAQLGILCKETMVTIPAVIGAYWWLLIKPQAPTLNASRMGSGLFPLVLGTATTWLTVAALYFNGYQTPGGGFNNSITASDWWSTQCAVIFVYLGLVVWPHPLIGAYDYPATTIIASWPWVMAAGVLVLLTVYGFVRRHPFVLGIAVFWIVLSPTLVVPLPGETIAERRMYLPLAAIVSMVVVSASRFCFAFIYDQKQTRVMSYRNAIGMACVIFALLVITCANLTHKRMSVYQSELAMAQDIYEKQQNRPIPNMNLGIQMAVQGKDIEALALLEEAVALGPELERTHFNLAYFFETHQEFAKAVSEYQKANQVRPSSETHYCLGRLYAQQGKWELAKSHYREACQLNSKNSEAFAALGVLLLVEAPDDREGIDEAIQCLERAAAIVPSAIQYHRLMIAYSLKGEWEVAKQYGAKGLEYAIEAKDKDLQQQIRETLDSL